MAHFSRKYTGKKGKIYPGKYCSLEMLAAIDITFVW